MPSTALSTAVAKAMSRLKRSANCASGVHSASQNAGKPPRKAKTKTAASGIRRSGSSTSEQDPDRREHLGLARAPAVRRLGRFESRHAHRPISFSTRCFQIAIDDLLLRLSPAAEIVDQEGIRDRAEGRVLRLQGLVRRCGSHAAHESRWARSLQRNATKASTSARSSGADVPVDHHQRVLAEDGAAPGRRSRRSACRASGPTAPPARR